MDSAPSPSRRPTTTLAPSWAKARAVARPIPEMPPVMRTTLSVNASSGYGNKLLWRSCG
ncbi:hypothetical protein [Leptolyngbya sp. FACHB-541]|uniref:hypothetical protein n=1 Tax=Leptolyngbya sp. FACHB-541 TaxID=2692810 RepID=UPI001F551447|nr:hypothetical protein [Leptolyngbya sp. FACHB-541]